MKTDPARLSTMLFLLGMVVCCTLPFFSCTPPRHAVVAPPAVQPKNTASASVNTHVPAAAVPDSSTNAVHDNTLSPATQLLIRACNNYLSVNPGSPKIVDVLMIKASLYYNNKQHDSARVVYTTIIAAFPGSSFAVDAMRMTAQSFYEEKRFDEAGTWYKKVSEASPDSSDKSEAIARIAESIYRLAEINDANGKFEQAAQDYERVALEYPESRIADVSLFNAGLAFEKCSQWPRAILAFQKLTTRYTASRLLPKTFFRIAKCYEKQSQWDLAAETYIRSAARFSSDSLAPAAMYNAGFCFENNNKLFEAAATFEKMVQLFPSTADAADVLFKAGELYGKTKDWDAVARVTTLFSKRFGNDENRIVQARCMTGIALYMRNKVDAAVQELENTVVTYKRLKNPGDMNAYYTAKALFTLGEIYEEKMAGLALGSQNTTYKKRLLEKSELLDKCIDYYAAAVKLNLSDWTTRSLFQIGQAYEDFAFGIFGQERPSDLSIDRRIALELGIAQAVEKYFIEKAIPIHERNVKLGIQQKLEDKYILQSRQKLTYLPYVAAENYLAIVEISRSAQRTEKLDGFALIARRLDTFQKIAPFQKRAIELYMQCLELGATYQEQNEFYGKASESITGLTCSAGSIYAEVVSIARDAPIPDGFDDYEKFVYKSKLLRQISGYEDQALENFLKTIKIADAYKLTDTSVTRAKQHIAELLFNRGRCYDLLCTTAFSHPPFPRNISDDEKEEYKARFEEIGLTFQEQAFDIYKNILGFAAKSYAEGPYVTHAYVRLYQNFPDTYGVKEQQMQQTAISTGPQWRCTGDTIPDWFTFAISDSAWIPAGRAPIGTAKISGFPGNTPIPMWLDSAAAEERQYRPDQPLFLRRSFPVGEMPTTALLYVAGQGPVTIYLNGDKYADTTLTFTGGAATFDLMGKLRRGGNLLAFKIVPESKNDHGLYPLIILTSGTNIPLPKPPGYTAPLSTKETEAGTYQFPLIKNFSTE